MLCSAQKSSTSWVSARLPISEPATLRRLKATCMLSTCAIGSSAPTSTSVASRLSSSTKGLMSCFSGTVDSMKSKLASSSFQGLLVVFDDGVDAQLPGLLDLSRG
jgi:hypothetical protein